MIGWGILGREGLSEPAVEPIVIRMSVRERTARRAVPTKGGPGLLWPTGQPANGSTRLSGLLLRLQLRRAAAIPGAATFLATASRGQPAAHEPTSCNAHDGSDDDGLEVHVRRMTT